MVDSRLIYTSLVCHNLNTELNAQLWLDQTSTFFQLVIIGNALVLLRYSFLRKIFVKVVSCATYLKEKSLIQPR